MADSPTASPEGDVPNKKVPNTKATKASTRDIEVDPKTVTVAVVPDDVIDAVPDTVAADSSEAAIALETESVDPGAVLDSTATSTIALDADKAASPVNLPNDVVPLPDTGSVFSRRTRIEGTDAGKPEPAAMLTADRLLKPNGRRKAAPEGRWPRFVYRATLTLVNLGDSPRVRYEKEIAQRINQPLEGGAKFIPVLTRKGGVGKTTITTLLGMALADSREDRVIAIDANPDRGTLSERVPKRTRMTVRDVVTRAGSVTGFTDLSSFVSRDATRLDVLASDTDPLLSEAFSDSDYEVVARLAKRHYSLVLTDCGTGIVHSVMAATLAHADTIVIVSGGSIDEARLASETLTWLESNGYAALAKSAVVAINTATQGTNPVRIDEIESHFESRVRAVVRIPYDQLLAAGGVITYADLHRNTRDAARELAALVMDGLSGL